MKELCRFIVFYIFTILHYLIFTLSEVEVDTECKTLGHRRGGIVAHKACGRWHLHFRVLAFVAGPGEEVVGCSKDVQAGDAHFLQQFLWHIVTQGECLEADEGGVLDEAVAAEIVVAHAIEGAWDVGLVTFGAPPV